MKYCSFFDTPLGRMTALSDGTALCGLYFDGQKHFPADIINVAKRENPPVFDITKKWLDIYFGGGIPDFTPPLKTCGTPFSTAVWDIIKTVPYGKTITYGEIAAVIAKKQGKKCMSARAVGNAVGKNPVSLIIPCHRVIGANGALTGYAAGNDKKEYLIILEKR